MNEDADPFRQIILQIQEAPFFNTISLEAIIALLIMLLLIFCSAMVSGSETAFFSIVPQKLKAHNGYKNVGKNIISMLEKPKRLLATILITNNFINVGIVVLGVFITEQLIHPDVSLVWSFLIQVVVLTAILLLFGEIMPKVYAAHSSYKFAQIMVKPLMVLDKVFYPLSAVLVSSTNAIDKRLRKKGHEITMDDINSAIDLTRQKEQTPEQSEEQKILKGIAKFGDIEVREIMKSRVDVVSVEEGEDYHSVLKIIKESGYSRIPVYKDSFDHIQGVIYIKDFLGNLEEEKDFNWSSMIRPAFFVPENKKISDLLIEFQEKKIHLAIVVDEYGGTSGIVTMEDVIEEIVGEIVDEFDNDDEHFLYKKIGENEYLFEGKVSLNDFCKAMQIDDKIFNHVRGDADTLAGFILEKLGQIPQKGTKVEHENFTFIVQSVSDRRITRITVKINE
ncbi:MAG: gliding motility-associated protein GldE [Bacteroidota bacterium]